MKWVTRKRIHVNRAATAWLIRRFLDPAAEILFVEPDEVATLQDRENAIGFDAAGARSPHQDARGRCSFEQLVDEHFRATPRSNGSRSSFTAPIFRRRLTSRRNPQVCGRSARASVRAPRKTTWRLSSARRSFTTHCWCTCGASANGAGDSSIEG